MSRSDLRFRTTTSLEELLSALEYLLPPVLAEEHRWWRFEGLDGIIPHLARKNGPSEAEVLGLCILISDQTLTPLHVRVGIAQDVDEIAWLDCKIGEPGSSNGGLRRIPYDRLSKELFLIGERAQAIDWVYRAQLGKEAGS